MTQQDFEHIVIPARKHAVATALRFGLSSDEAEDVAQDVMLRLWAMHDQLRTDLPIPTYAAFIAKQRCIDLWRLRHEEQEIDDTLYIIEESNQQDQLESKELEEWLLRQIERMPSTSGIVLRMRQIEHRELSDIATLLGITQHSAETLLSRARRQLMEQLKRRNKL